MRIEMQQATLLLARGGLVKLHAGRGTRIRCLSGTIWVTQAGELKDAFLTRGKGLVVRSRALTLLESLGEATVTLVGGRNGAESDGPCRLRWVPYY